VSGGPTQVVVVTEKPIVIEEGQIPPGAQVITQANGDKVVVIEENRKKRGVRRRRADVVKAQ